MALSERQLADIAARRARAAERVAGLRERRLDPRYCVRCLEPLPGPGGHSRGSFCRECRRERLRVQKALWAWLRDQERSAQPAEQRDVA